jgi:hypothetical protein
MGVVIGETTTISNNVVMYHQVTIVFRIQFHDYTWKISFYLENVRKMM